MISFFGSSLSEAALHVCTGFGVITEPDNDHPVERSIGLTVASPVESMPEAFPGRRFDR